MVRRLPLLVIAVGIAGLLVSRHHAGPGAPFLRALGANLTFSFAAVGLMALFLVNRPRRIRVALASALALAGVVAQEASQGLGLYPGVFDPADILFDALGVAAGGVVLLVGDRDTVP